MRTPVEDRFIFGEPGFYYVIIGEIQAGYFSTKLRARRFVRKHL
jgi:hypothetical protein